MNVTHPLCVYRQEVVQIMDDYRRVRGNVCVRPKHINHYYTYTRNADMIENYYQTEYEVRALANKWWACQEGSGESWEAARKKYRLTASVMSGLWNGSGYERTGNILNRLITGECRIFSNYTRVMMEQGQQQERETLTRLFRWVVGSGTWKLSPGIFEIDIGKETVGASPDAMLYCFNQHIPVEVKYHAGGQCKVPLPCGYFAQLYTQMMATRAMLGLYAGRAPDDTCYVAIVKRTAKTDDAFHKRVRWFINELNEAIENKHIGRYPEAIDELESLRDRCLMHEFSKFDCVLKYLKVCCDELGENPVYYANRYKFTAAPNELPLPEMLMVTATPIEARKRAAPERLDVKMQRIDTGDETEVDE